jgi:5,10-methylenetetrahydromethanopterin reductase
MRPEISIRIPPCEPVSQLADVALDCERLGYAGVWFPDSQLLWRDPFLTAGAALERTTTLRVGIAVTNVVTRHVSVVSGLFRSLYEIGGERFQLGLGTGSSSIGTVGLSSSRTSEFRAAVETLKTFGSGGTHDFGSGPVRQESPAALSNLVIAATGPRNLELAGEVADGVLILNGSDTQALQRSIDLVRKGESRRAAGAASPKLIVTSFCLPTDHPEKDARLLKPICVAMAQQLGARSAIEAAGISVSHDLPSGPVYPDLVHAQDADVALRAVDHLVSDEDVLRFARTFCLFGSLEEIAGQIEKMSALGVAEVMLQHIGSFDVPRAWIDQCAPLTGPLA